MRRGWEDENVASPDAPLLRALRGDRPDHTPVWFMRQAGRSLPEYRELRVGTRMLDACLTPDLAAEITLQPARRHGVGAGSAERRVGHRGVTSGQARREQVPEKKT